jgi:hypothetical protein
MWTLLCALATAAEVPQDAEPTPALPDDGEATPKVPDDAEAEPPDAEATPAPLDDAEVTPEIPGEPEEPEATSAMPAAAEPPADTLALQVWDEERWTDVDRRASRSARAGLVVGVAGGVMLGAGIGLSVLDDPLYSEFAPPLLFGGVVGSLVGPPLMLSGAMRANSALRHRGVYGSTSTGVAGWTLLGSAIVALPVSIVAWPVGPTWYAGVLALGAGQLEVNRRVRSAAGLEPVRPITVVLRPTPDGFLLAGTFQ